MKWWLKGAALLSVGIVIAPLFAPSLMAFPYHARVGKHDIYSVTAIPPQIIAVIRKADSKVASSPTGGARSSNQPIFLTGGGWRWAWLAAGNQGAFAITRVSNDAVIIKDANVRDNFAYRDANIGGRRSLSGFIAHEMTHGSIRSRFGILADFSYPTALREGYCDYVAGEGSLSDHEAQTLIQQQVAHPALPYWHGRKRIEAKMAKPGYDIDRLFGQWRADDSSR